MNFRQAGQAVPQRFFFKPRFSTTKDSQPPPFGSSSPRFSSITQKHQYDLGPGSYVAGNISNPSFSEKGYGALCSRTKRFRRAPKSAAPVLQSHTSPSSPKYSKPSPWSYQPSTSRLIPPDDSAPPDFYNTSTSSAVPFLASISFKSSSSRSSLVPRDAPDLPGPFDYYSTDSSTTQTKSPRTSFFFAKPVEKPQNKGIFPIGTKPRSSPGPGDYDVPNSIKISKVSRPSPCFQSSVKKPDTNKTVNDVEPIVDLNPDKPSRNVPSCTHVFKKSDTKPRRKISTFIPGPAMYQPTPLSKKIISN
ncbi:hypothetical protein GEMRC1_007037 [Eukaryota sp. GEM-RC1]